MFFSKRKKHDTRLCIMFFLENCILCLLVNRVLCFLSLLSIYHICNIRFIKRTCIYYNTIVPAIIFFKICHFRPQMPTYCAPLKYELKKSLSLQGRGDAGAASSPLQMREESI